MLQEEAQSHQVAVRLFRTLIQNSAVCSRSERLEPVKGSFAGATQSEADRIGDIVVDTPSLGISLERIDPYPKLGYLVGPIGFLFWVSKGLKGTMNHFLRLILVVSLSTIVSLQGCGGGGGGGGPKQCTNAGYPLFCSTHGGCCAPNFPYLCGVTVVDGFNGHQAQHHEQPTCFANACPLNTTPLDFCAEE